MDNIINKVRGKVCGGVSSILLAYSGFDEEEEYCLEIGVRDVQEIDPW